MQNEAKLLTIAQAAQLLQVSSDTLRRWEDKGLITPLRTKGGSRRYTLLDLKIAKLNKRKSRFSQIPVFFKQNYINSKRDLKIALFTSFLWIAGLLIYQTIPPIFLRPTNPQQQIVSDPLKEQTRLKVVSQTAPNQINAIKVLVIANQETPAKEQAISKITSPESDLLIKRVNNLPNLKFIDVSEEYYSLQPLSQKEIFQ